MIVYNEESLPWCRFLNSGDNRGRHIVDVDHADDIFSAPKDRDLALPDWFEELSSLNALRVIKDSASKNQSGDPVEAVGVANELLHLLRCIERRALRCR